MKPDEKWGTASQHHSTLKVKNQNSFIYRGILLWIKSPNKLQQSSNARKLKKKTHKKLSSKFDMGF